MRVRHWHEVVDESENSMQRWIIVISSPCQSEVDVQRMVVQRDELDVALGDVLRHRCESEVTTDLGIDQRQRRLGVWSDLDDGRGEARVVGEPAEPIGENRAFERG